MERLIHIHAGGTPRTFCGLPFHTTNVSWEQATEANCPPCASHFGRRVPQYGPEWVAHATSGGRILDGNLLVGVTA